MASIVNLEITKNTVPMGRGPKEQFIVEATGADSFRACTPLQQNLINGNNILVFEMDTCLYNWDTQGNEDRRDFVTYKECDNMDMPTTTEVPIVKDICYCIDNESGMGIMVFYKKNYNDMSMDYDDSFETTIDASGSEIKYILIDSNGDTTGFTDIQCCVHPDTQVFTNYGYKCIKDIDSTSEVKLQDINGNLVDLHYNIWYIPTKDFILVSKGSLGENKPSQDLYIRSGHGLHIDGKEVPCEELINDDTIRRVTLDKPTPSYSICLKDKTAVLMNNVLVYTWGHEEWENFAVKNNIVWKKL
jgi:hypothetical protein